MPTVNQSEAARILGISRRTVKRRIEAGELEIIDTPEGTMVVLDPPYVEDDAPTPAHGHAHPNAHQVPTSGIDAVNDINGAESAPLDSDLAARLERAESRIDRLLETVHAQNQTIQAQTIRLAQLEGRMLDARPAETPTEPPSSVNRTDIPAARPGRLRAWYMRWRGGH